MDLNGENINMVDVKKAKKTVVATGISNVMEQFDFGAYAYITAYIEANFFSPVEGTDIRQMLTFATLAVVFLLRPIGGVVSGIIGDKYGCKVVLALAVILVAFSTLTIGLLLSYDQIGLWASILLLPARVLQGFLAGEEHAGAITYVAESLPDKRRNPLDSRSEIGTLSGYITASVMIVLLIFFLTDEQIASFSWRTPFLLDLFPGLFGLYLRRRLEEPPVSEDDVAAQSERDSINFLQIIRFHYKDMSVCLVAVVFFDVTNYMVTAYLPTYLEQVIRLDATTVSVLITRVMAIMILLVLMFGKLVGKIDEKKVFLVGTGGLTLFSIIVFMLLHSQPFVMIVIGTFGLGFFSSTYETTMPGSLPTMFYGHIRHQILSVTFNISVSIFGGTTPLVATWLVMKTGDPLALVYYLTAISVIGFLVITFLHLSIAGKSLRDSYLDVDNKQDRAYCAEYPKETLWWVKGRKDQRSQ